MAKFVKKKKKKKGLKNVHSIGILSKFKNS